MLVYLFHACPCALLLLGLRADGDESDEFMGHASTEGRRRAPEFITVFQLEMK